ncbi:hypothetical protein GN956_G11552 [Arapaima gigas]
MMLRVKGLPRTIAGSLAAPLETLTRVVPDGSTTKETVLHRAPPAMIESCMNPVNQNTPPQRSINLDQPCGFHGNHHQLSRS